MGERAERKSMEMTQAVGVRGDFKKKPPLSRTRKRRLGIKRFDGENEGANLCRKRRERMCRG